MLPAADCTQESVEQNPLLRPAHVHHHHAGFHGHRYVLAVQDHNLGRRKHLVFEQAAVALVLCHSGRWCVLRRRACGSVETVIGGYGVVLERIVVEIYGCCRWLGLLVFLEVLAQHRDGILHRRALEVDGVAEGVLSQRLLYSCV